MGTMGPTYATPRHSVGTSGSSPMLATDLLTPGQCRIEPPELAGKFTMRPSPESSPQYTRSDFLYDPPSQAGFTHAAPRTFAVSVSFQHGHGKVSRVG
jgi:hypothetical protein